MTQGVMLAESALIEGVRDIPQSLHTDSGVIPG
jgi:hypothetical protein